MTSDVTLAEPVSPRQPGLRPAVPPTSGVPPQRQVMPSARPGRGQPHRSGEQPGASWRSARVLEIAQDLITVAVGVLLVLLATALLISGVADFVRSAVTTSSPTPVAHAAYKLLDTGLLVLILAEIVHTVVLSLRTHRLIAQPFLIVGLVAVIRRILALLGSSAPIGTTEFALLIAMVVVFVGGLIAVRRFGNAGESGAGLDQVDDAARNGARAAVKSA